MTGWIPWPCGETRQKWNRQDKRCISQEFPTSNQQDQTKIVLVLVKRRWTFHWGFFRPCASAQQAPEERNHRYFHVLQRTKNVLWQPYRKDLFTACVGYSTSRLSVFARLRCKRVWNRMRSFPKVSPWRTKTERFLVSFTPLRSGKLFPLGVEWLTVVWVLKTLFPYLMYEKFMVYTEHTALHWHLAINDQSGRFLRCRLIQSKRRKTKQRCVQEWLQWRNTSKRRIYHLQDSRSSNQP